jgi:hypothetical protein
MKGRLWVYILCIVCLNLFVISGIAEPSTQRTTSADDAVAAWRVVPVTINESIGKHVVTPSNVSAENASISGTVFDDLNANGFREEGEPGLANWTIVLKLDDKDFEEVTTNDQGFYLFEDLEPGNYTVEQELMEGWDQTSPAQGIYNIILVTGQGLNYDFGNINRKVLASLVPIPESHPLISRSEWIRMAEEVEAAPMATAIDLQKIEGRPTVSYPSSFNLLDYVPYHDQRNQGSCGNCWAWATTGLAEVALKTQLNQAKRLSIQYLDSNFVAGGGRWACCGGNVGDFLNFYNSKKKFILWDNLNAQYQDGLNHCCHDCSAGVCSNIGCCAGSSCGGIGHSSVSATSISENPNYPIGTIPFYYSVNHKISQDQAINAIKNILTQNKAMVFSFYLPSTAAWNSFSSTWNSGGVWDPQPYCGKPEIAGSGGHAVLCVGYDDASDTWIMLNSWGLGGRKDGTFRVKMHMNYDCSNSGYYSYYFQYFDVPFTVQNRPPYTPDTPLGETSGVVGVSYGYTTSTTDPDNNQIRYTFRWGDETTTQTGLVNSGTSVTENHIWTVAKAYQVDVKAKDSNDAPSNWSIPLEVTISTNNPPDKPSVPDADGITSGKPKTSYEFSTTATDPDKNQIMYTFDWGDRTKSTTGWGDSGIEGIASHAWRKAGQYQVRAMATNSNGASSAWSDSLEFIVAANRPPQTPSKPVGDASGQTRTLYEFSTTATDPDGDQIKYTFDWGDHAKTTTGLVNSGNEDSSSHAWRRAGQYQIRAKATDSNGVSSAWSEACSITIGLPSRPIKPARSTMPHL